VAYVVSIVATGPQTLSGWQVLCLVAGVACVSTSLVITARQARAERRYAQSCEAAARESRDRTRVALQDALAPVTRHLAALITAPATCRSGLRAQSIDKALHAAVALAGGDRVRACWFRLDDGARRILRPESHLGRSQPPTTIFVEGTPSGDAVFAALDEGIGRFCQDVVKEPPTGWDARVPRAYRSFIAVPVTDGVRCHGMLTLDSLRPDALRGDDVPLMHLLAQMLATAMAIEPNRVPDRARQAPSEPAPARAAGMRRRGRGARSPRRHDLTWGTGDQGAQPHSALDQRAAR